MLRQAQHERKMIMISLSAPFALSPSTSLRTGLSKGERRVFKHSPRDCRGARPCALLLARDPVSMSWILLVDQSLSHPVLQSLSPSVPLRLKDSPTDRLKDSLTPRLPEMRDLTDLPCFTMSIQPGWKLEQQIYILLPFGVKEVDASYGRRKQRRA
jgi:hypothetical protein